jgi:hypothetical protein
LLNFFFTHIPNGLTRVMVEPREDELVIEAQGLRMEFRGLVAVESLDLSIAKGTLYGLIGPNGSGKTTAIKMLVGLLRPSGGQAMVLGESVPLQSNRTKLGYMPQENAVYGDHHTREPEVLWWPLFGAKGSAHHQNGRATECRRPGLASGQLGLPIERGDESPGLACLCIDARNFGALGAVYYYFRSSTSYDRVPV